ncbi:hypothetical protein [Gordonia sp. (in: high G+C Gram-positive bacteria)]|uniref:hypothetical protein n=1 Tax=Gordonia sp. (in: high G+C Gram-positive bacteria) TaxID=84139 RepID=UPI0039E5BD04
MRTVYLADHSVVLALPAFVPAFIVVGVIVAMVVRDRRRGDDEHDDQPFLDEDEMLDEDDRQLDESTDDRGEDR